MHDVSSNSENNNFIENDKSSILDDNTHEINNYIGDNNNANTIAKNLPVGHLPRELLEFFKNDSYSLLIKGKPGAGKTTFALTLMDNLEYDSNYFYISTRLSNKQLSHFYPWISKFSMPVESKFEYKFEDARLDEPESLFERITNQLMDVKSPIIIIDTWDAIASFMDNESRLNNERVLQIWRERAGAKLIFLSETYDVSLLDSIVDGVVTLKCTIKNSTYSRKLYINKLRGISVNCSKYLFSLFDGYFHILDPIDSLNIFDKFKKNMNKNLDNDTNNSNPINLQSKLKGNNFNFFNELFQYNKLVTIEFDSNLNNELILSILFKSLYFWMVSNNSVLINNFKWDFYNHLKELMTFFKPLGLSENEDSLIQNIKFENSDNDCACDKNLNAEISKELHKVKHFEKYMDNILNDYSSKNKNNNILNIMDGNNNHHLFSDINFIKCLKNNSIANNLVVFKTGAIHKFETLISESQYYKIILKGKNILMTSLSDPPCSFGAIIDNNNYFVDWYPIY